MRKRIEPLGIPSIYAGEDVNRDALDVNAERYLNVGHCQIHPAE
jgi:hypothetical protein